MGCYTSTLTQLRQPDPGVSKEQNMLLQPTACLVSLLFPFHAHKVLSAGRTDALLDPPHALKWIYLNGKSPCCGKLALDIDSCLIWYTEERKQRIVKTSNLSQCSCLAFSLSELGPSHWFCGVVSVHLNQRGPSQLWGRGGKGLGRKLFGDWDFLNRYSDFVRTTVNISHNI